LLKGARNCARKTLAEIEQWLDGVEARHIYPPTPQLGNPHWQSALLKNKERSLEQMEL